jgi:hypothetical protein
MSDSQSPIPAQAQQRDPPKDGSTPPLNAPQSGRRQAFQDLKRGLTDTELASTGTQKLLLDMLECAEAERDEYKQFVGKFHEADKRTGVLEEKQQTNRTNEVMFGVMVGVGGTAIGLAPAIWDNGARGPLWCILCAGVGLALIGGASFARIRFK